MTTMRSTFRAISSMEWLTRMTVLPFCLWYERSWAKMASRPRGSNPAVGSSRIKTLGSIAMTPAMATRRFCPPESSKGDFSSISSSMPAKAAARRTRQSISSPSRPMFFGPKEMSL